MVVRNVLVQCARWVLFTVASPSVHHSAEVKNFAPDRRHG